MNPINKIRNWFIGEALAKTDDVFEKGKIELLFNFSCLFLLLSFGFYFTSLHAPWFQKFLSIQGIVLLLGVIVTLKTTKNILWASYTYIFSHSLQSLGFLIFGNGVISPLAIPFLILYISFGFLLLGRKWGYLLTFISIVTVCLAVYNTHTGYSLYFFPGGEKLKEPPEILLLIPLLLNAYLVSHFLKARLKAEKQIEEQKRELEKSHFELEQKNKDTIASINYASRIQQAMLPTEENILRGIPLSFVLYKPRDIVCGDFYWFHPIDSDNYIIVCADCTGHGVPGALMTMIGNSLLNQIVIDGSITAPAKILDELDKRISGTLKQQKQHDSLIQDSMDLALLKVNKKERELIFCGAKRPCIYLHNGQLTEFKGNKYTLGGLSEAKTFEETRQKYQEDDVIYLFTDGYADQFGGDENKKYLIKHFREILEKIHSLPMTEQKAKLNTAIENWKKQNTQTDDILVIGIKF